MLLIIYHPIGHIDKMQNKLLYEAGKLVKLPDLSKKPLFKNIIIIKLTHIIAHSNNIIY